MHLCDTKNARKISHDGGHTKHLYWLVFFPVREAHLYSAQLLVPAIKDLILYIALEIITVAKNIIKHLFLPGLCIKCLKVLPSDRRNLTDLVI